MRTALHFLWLMAIGLAVSTVALLAAPTWLPLEGLGFGPRSAGPDYVSLTIGLAVGLLLGAFWGVSWSEPRGLAVWLFSAWPAVRLVALAGLCVAVLFYL
jgi:hypothetical protein